MIHFFPVKNDSLLRTTALLLTASCVLPLCVSCSSNGGISSASPKAPYAENAPKTKEEEDYYQDVYSGDWKKQKTNPLGYFGLGRYQASTTPPPHWSMEVPKGAKTMEEIRQESYASRTGERERPVDPRYASTESSPENPPKTAAAPSSSRIPNELDGALHNEASSDESESRPQKEKPNKKSIFDGWTRFQPKSDSLKNRKSLDIAKNSGNSLILRGQAPSPQAGRSVTSTADSVVSPIKIDPSLAETWHYVDGRGLTAQTDRKDLPEDEYIADGGDTGSETYAMPNWDVHNLESEETIAHFDTLGGKILVEPSNRVLIYSPRFGTVRQVVGPKSESQNVQLVKMENEITSTEKQSREGIDYRTQETGIKMTRGNLQATGIGANQPGGVASGEMGVMENSAQARLAAAGGALKERVIQDKDRVAVTDGVAAATAWGEVQGVSVQIDRIAAQGNITLQGAETLYKIDNDTKSSQLRLVKVASKKEATSGELIEFTLRFENVGTELIGNVTILDSLSPRLEYVADSAKSSKNANFLVKNNETGSLLLRWEITDPLEPNDFGVLTFLCKVR